MNSKKLLIVGSNSIHVINFYQLIKHYFTDIVLVTSSPIDFDDDKIKNKYVVNCSLKNPFNYFTAVKQLQQIIYHEQPNIIHIQQIVAYNFLTLRANRKTKIPIVSTAWGSDILLTPHKGFVFKKMIQYCLKKANHFTADAQYIADEMQKLISKKINISIVNFGIDIEKYFIEKENIIYSNRLHNKLYRIDSIIDIFSRFVKKTSFSDWKLVIAATGTETEKLKQKVHDMQLDNAIQFVGWLSKEDNQKWYAKAKIWIALPESDATAISLLEAMNNGCIPIISDLPATREWITNEENGILVTNPTSFSLENVFKIDIEKAIATNEAIIKNRATKNINSEKFINIYKSFNI